MGDEAFCGKDIVGRDCAVVGKCNLRPGHMPGCAEVTLENAVLFASALLEAFDAKYCPTCGQPVSKA